MENPEVIITYHDVGDRMISDGKLHAIATASTAHCVSSVKYVVDGRINCVGRQTVITIAANSLVHIILDDLADLSRGYECRPGRCSGHCWSLVYCNELRRSRCFLPPRWNR